MWEHGRLEYSLGRSCVVEVWTFSEILFFFLRGRAPTRSRARFNRPWGRRWGYTGRLCLTHRRLRFGLNGYVVMPTLQKIHTSTFKMMQPTWRALPKYRCRARGPDLKHDSIQGQRYEVATRRRMHRRAHTCCRGASPRFHRCIMTRLHLAQNSRLNCCCLVL